MSRTQERIRERSRRARAKYGELFKLTEALFFRHDPIGISFENPKIDEYALETENILPRLGKCKSSEDVLQVVHEEFVHSFFADTAGPPEHYAQLASELWELWRVHGNNSNAL
jgi:hypothetical protein